jgi:hypothetical protein
MVRSKNDTGRQPLSTASDSLGSRKEQQPPRALTPKPANPGADGHGENAVFLTESQLAARHQKSVKTIRNLRVSGGYIPYVKIGRHVRYRLDDIVAYEKSHLKRFTSDEGGDNA